MDGLFHGKSIYKWMMTKGTPISGNLEMWIHLSLGSCRVLWHFVALPILGAARQVSSGENLGTLMILGHL